MNQNEQEKTNQAVGKQTIRFACPPAILSRASIVGDMEGQGPLASYFDQIEPDPAFGMDSWEEGESEMVRRALARFRTALKQGEKFSTGRFDFCGYDGTLWCEPRENGDMAAGFSKEYRNCGNGYYYLLINDEYMIGYDID